MIKKKKANNQKLSRRVAASLGDEKALLHSFSNENLKTEMV